MNVAFNPRTAEKHKFTCSGDRYRKIMAWLSPRTAMSQVLLLNGGKMPIPSTTNNFRVSNASRSFTWTST
jgi:hypothetical protein